MGSIHEWRKPRFLCLHGMRTNADILKKELVRKWDSVVLDKLDLVFVDAPFPCLGKSDVEGIYDPPYYEWFHMDKGGMLAGALPILQEKGLVLTKVPKIKCVIIIGAAKISRDKFLAENAYDPQIRCPSVHIIGKGEGFRESAIQLVECYVDPIVIHHPKGHTIPRLDDKSLGEMLSFIERIERDINKTERSSLRHKSKL
ncbi:unnamed protein product [Cuscuta europaea]|uniref:Serine hydrolase domain-containing protein n=1 Tax=Cuscuta europaea TaxID=41803 RepID=A0A9P1E4G9_CUSEU|nr:unnamed protein product [Cuscuta europaea]